jgi:hypothetical protein
MVGMGQPPYFIPAENNAKSQPAKSKTSALASGDLSESRRMVEEEQLDRCAAKQSKHDRLYL